MTVAAITITYNRLDLTKKTVESFQEKTGVDYHVFIDNGSTDGTSEYIEQFNHIKLDRNDGIAYAFTAAFNSIPKHDFILKLDNDIETVTPDIINRMLTFYEQAGDKFVVSPVDLNLDKRFAPINIKKLKLGEFHVQITSHTGGAFQMIPYDICKKLCSEYRHLAKGDFMIGNFYRRCNYNPAYLLDLEMRHIGLNRTSPNYKL